jgi:hypothetical protein
MSGYVRYHETWNEQNTKKIVDWFTPECTNAEAIAHLLYAFEGWSPHARLKVLCIMEALGVSCRGDQLSSAFTRRG